MRRLRLLLIPACALALAIPASALGLPGQDLRSPDARDAARAASPAPAQRNVDPTPSARLNQSSETDDQTLAIALASAALAIALAGLAVALGALLRRPRSRWSVS